MHANRNVSFDYSCAMTVFSRVVKTECVCVYGVCMGVYICVYGVYACMRVCVYVYACVCIYVCMYACVYIYGGV